MQPLNLRDKNENIYYNVWFSSAAYVIFPLN